MTKVTFHRVAEDGILRPRSELGAASLDGDRVTYTGAVAEETIQMLARRFRRSEAEIVALVAKNGWSNGQIVAATAL